MPNTNLTLSTAVQTTGRMVRLTLTGATLPAPDLPQGAHAPTHWTQLVHTWAVDWTYQGDLFVPQWQASRSKKQPALILTCGHTYPAPGPYTIGAMVVDLFGHTTITPVPVEVI